MELSSALLNMIIVPAWHRRVENRFLSRSSASEKGFEPWSRLVLMKVMDSVSRKVHYMHIDSMLGTASPEWWSLRPDVNTEPWVKKHHLKSVRKKASEFLIPRAWF